MRLTTVRIPRSTFFHALWYCSATSSCLKRGICEYMSVRKVSPNCIAVPFFEGHGVFGDDTSLQVYTSHILLLLAILRNRNFRSLYQTLCSFPRLSSASALPSNALTSFKHPSNPAKSAASSMGSATGDRGGIERHSPLPAFGDGVAVGERVDALALGRAGCLECCAR